LRGCGTLATARLVKYKGKHGDIWRIRLDYVDQQTGERQRPYESLPPGTTKKQAEERMRQRLTDLGEAPAPASSKITLGTLLVEWLDQDARAHVGITTLPRYEATCRVHLIPELGMIPLAKVTTPLLSQWQHTYGKQHGGRTMQLCHLRLSQALAYAVRIGYLARNPMHGVRFPPHTAAVKAIWEPVDCARFLTAAEHAAYYPIWHFILGTGCRRGEALGLLRSGLDETAGTATISQSVVALGGRGYIKSTKTAWSHRQIPVPPELFALLRDHLAAQTAHRERMDDAYQDLGLVFPSKVGSPINPNNLARDFSMVLDLAGVPRISIHGLRHTAATLALEGGEPIEVIRQLLGHKRISTTADIYARVKPPATMRAAETIQRLLRNEHAD
jgi:integrase